MPRLARIDATTWEVQGDTTVRLGNLNPTTIDRALTGMLYDDAGSTWMWDPSQQTFLEFVAPAEDG